MWEFLESITVQSLWSIDLAVEMSPRGWRHALVGLQEASERLSNDDSLQWLKWAPLFFRDHAFPSVRFVLCLGHPTLFIGLKWPVGTDRLVFLTRILLELVVDSVAAVTVDSLCVCV